jgi:hypothetical protein
MNVSRSWRRIALALGLGALLIGPALSLGWPGPAPTYYRVTASLSHGDEPIEFDVVVECRHSTTGGFGSPVRGTSTRSPWIYGQRTRAGHAVFLHMPNGCLLTDRVEEQFRPRVPPDLLPLILWSEKDDDFSLLTAYVSETGYQHPLSRLTFHKATMTPATAEDHRAWKARAPPNLVTKQNVMFPRNQCHGVRPIPLPDKERGVVRQLWPADRPTYWRPPDDAVLEPIAKAAAREFFGRSGGRGLSPRVEQGYALPRYPGTGELLRQASFAYKTALSPFAHVPVLPEIGPPVAKRGADGRSQPYSRIDVFADQFRSPGLMYCYEWYGLQRPAELSIDGITFPVRAHAKWLGFMRDEALLDLETFIPQIEWGGLDD